MVSKKLPKKIMKIIKGIRNKRAKIVIDHILKHGFITTEDLEKKYGYNHPPRAARDVREAGIPLETFKVKSSGRRSIAAYKFGDFKKIRKDRLEGRLVFSKKLKDDLYHISGGKCAICLGIFEKRYLQVDHKIPYEIAGENEKPNSGSENYMLLCGSCNRAKSWSCEHCLNWSGNKIAEICLGCYWGNPTDYSHIALNEIRRLDIIWDKFEITDYEKLKQTAEKNKSMMPAYVKKIIKNQLK
jgi:hypothetical protein